VHFHPYLPWATNQNAPTGHPPGKNVNLQEEVKCIIAYIFPVSQPQSATRALTGKMEKVMSCHLSKNEKDKIGI